MLYYDTITFCIQLQISANVFLVYLYKLLSRHLQTWTFSLSWYCISRLSWLTRLSSQGASSLQKWFCAIVVVWWHNNLEQWVQTKYICVSIWLIILPKTWHRSKSSTAFWHEEQILQFYLWQEMEDLTMFHLLFVWLKPLQFLLQRTPFPSAWNLLNRSWTVLLKIRSVWTSFVA